MTRDISLDIIRVIAICMIVFMHSPIPGSAPGFILSGLSYITAAGIGLFFMVSGALLLNTSLKQKDFLKRRFSKIIWPTLFWTFFYLAVKWFSNGTTTIELARTICTIPFAPQGHGVLWFMYTLAGLYMLTPILSAWLKTASKREIEFYLALWAISLVYPYLRLVLNFEDNNTNILYYFTGYVGYFLLGYYINNHYRFKAWHLAVAAIIAIGVPIVFLKCNIKCDFYEVLWYLSLPVAMMSFSWFVIIQRIKVKREPSLLISASRLSFGIYLIHIFVMRDGIWNLSAIQQLQSIIQISTIAISTFILSWLICWCISKLPFSKYIIGI